MHVDIRVQGRAADRMASVQRWVVQRLGSCRHERRVMGIAARLFDLTAPEHGLPPAYRRMLRFGSLLHDVGRSFGARRHHIQGARMIQRSRALPLRPEEREVAAFLARYHRKAVPGKGQIRDAAPGLPVDAMRTLLALLRAADALDSRRLVASALTMRLVGRRLRVRCFVTARPGRAARAFDKPRKFRLLKDALGVSVDLQIRRDDASDVQETASVGR